MRLLYHYPLCPYSRKVRLILSEKKLDFSTKIERFWEGRSEFIKMNLAGQVPVLVELNGAILSNSGTIAEYLEEAYPELPLLMGDLTQRAETRRLVAWFDEKFNREVTEKLLLEKHLKRYMQATSSPPYSSPSSFPLSSTGPDSKSIRQAKGSIHFHLDYISWLVDRRNWLAGDYFSLADITAASHLSVVDYFGDVPWESHILAKEWYVRIKSRPTFRTLLQDKVAGLSPVDYYANLDF